VPVPVADYVDFVRVGNLLFLAGNTAGADWKFKGKVGKDITVQKGYEKQLGNGPNHVSESVGGAW
jgi:hypothetical protein